VTASLQTHIAIIGGGAAGIFAAIQAAANNSNNKRIIVIEKTNKLLQKVKVSGGGRCNVTHACFNIPDLIKHYPRGQHFVKKAFHQFYTTNTVDWFKEQGVTLHAEADGRMFPSTNSSQTIIDCFMRLLDKYKVEIIYQSAITDITKTETGFNLYTANHATIHCKKLLIASGGYPKTEQFSWLAKLGHTIVDTNPSLFTFNIAKGNAILALQGVSVPEATVKITKEKMQFTGPLLITHWGFSGPAVLKLSAFAAVELANVNYHTSFTINWLPNISQEKISQALQKEKLQNRTKIINNNIFGLPKRLWQFMLEACQIPAEKLMLELGNAEINKLTQWLSNSNWQMEGKTTFKEEFVTCGGVHTSEVNANTMESKLHKNLYFAGEALNVDGITGGFNFQHAWTSGFIAAKGLVGV
jgi:predicted Rossmann fold flavoprotein